MVVMCFLTHILNNAISIELFMSVYCRLLSCLPEHLTAEIVQLTVTDITKAIEWMKCSYLYVRMKKACTDCNHLKILSRYSFPLIYF